MRSSTARFLACVVSLGLSLSPLSAQQSQPNQPGAPASDVSNIPRSITDTLDRLTIRDLTKRGDPGKKITEKDETCLLPPLTWISSPTIAAEQLQLAAKAEKEYHLACAALKKKKTGDVEEHLRKAVQLYPKYSVAWVTLGQVLAAQQRTEEGRTACLQGSIVNPSYVPAYLCLADIAARAHAWDEVLKASGHALELDPANDAVAYEYYADANLNLHELVQAEKSGLRAVAIDKDHHEPRVYFVLAQIYEAKGDPINEAVQLREYVKYADDPKDVAIVQQYLSKLEQYIAKGRTVDYPQEGNSTEVFRVPTRRWGPADIDDIVPPVRTDTACPLPVILKETSRRTQAFIENLQRFSATERIEQIDVGKNGKNHTTAAEVVNYVAQVEENSSGYPTVKEYRYGSNGAQHRSLMDSGTAALALIFHPSHVGNFNFRCEGLTEPLSSPAWQVHFEENADSNQPFQAIWIAGSLYLPRFKGRAWIATDTYDVLRIETDLVSPIPQIDLQLEHLVIGYAPVEFENQHIRLWLPESASVYIDYHGHRYQRVHNFSKFQLFSVDTSQAVKEPPTPPKWMVE